MPFESSLADLKANRNLQSEQATGLMGFLVGGQAPDAFIADTLIAINAKGVTGVELAAFAGVLRSHALSIPHTEPRLVDTCGTGGGRPSFNLSTAAAIIAAAAGAKVAKHGNRGVTSRCGSADVLEALGVRLTEDPEALIHVLDSVGMVFLFAQHHHPAMRNVGAVRKALGVRTVFNLLGPLANPAGAKRQLIGVYDRKFLEPVSEALSILGVEKALVVHGHDGMDEISPCTNTFYRLVDGGTIVDGEFDSPDVPDSALTPAETIAGNAEILREAIRDPHSLRAKAVLPNAAATLWISGLVESHREGIEVALDAIASGRAYRKLEHLIEETQAI